ncbi:PTS system, sugar-specific IIA component [Enterococcus sp. AZ067]|uniref:PTS sugar transporter subunit IIA n=1 Tax=Enterococcus sp. AZ067 TaxID=2774674 RepID=UPI003F2934CA
MFGLKKKIKYDENLYSPVDGELLNLEDVKDKVFSSKMMGDGFAVKPEIGIIAAPCDGIITMVFPTNHAFAITSSDGKEILVHIGIDTVNLKGQGFESLVKQNEKVSLGQDVIRFDKNSVEKNHDITTMVVITNAVSGKINEQLLHKKVKVKELAMTFD